jgi:hypothetical protein
VIARLGAYFFRGCTPERLGATRFLIGAGLLPFHVLQYYTLLALDWSGPSFWFVHRIWYFEALGIERCVPALAALALAILLLATAGFAVGYRTRACAVVSLLAIAYLKGVRDSVAGDVHHRELVPFAVLLLFAFSRCGDVASFDSRRTPPPRLLDEWEASWPIRAAQVHVASFYFWSGLAKVRMAGWDWIRDGERLQVLLLNRAFRFGIDASGEPEGSPLALWFAHQNELLMALALATIVMELGFPALLFLRSFGLRALFLAGVSFFHLANFVLMKVKFVFLPVVFVLFFDPSPLLSWLNRERGPVARSAEAS